MRAARATLLFLLSVVLMLWCNPDPPGEGALVVRVRITADPQGKLATLSSMHFEPSRVDVVWEPSTNGPEQVLHVNSSPFSFDIPIHKDFVQNVALLDVPPGIVTQVRFVWASVAVTWSGDGVVKTPGGSETGLKVIPQTGNGFAIADGVTTEIEVQVDPNKQLVANRGQGILLKPLARAVVVPVPGNPTIPLYNAHRVYVCFKDGTPPAKIASINALMGATVVRQSATRPWQVLQLPPLMNEMTARDMYNSFSEVAVAMLDYNSQFLNLVPEEWPSEATTNQQDLVKTSSPGAWDKTTGDDFPIVAVVDDAINIFNPDLEENIFLNDGERPAQVTLGLNCQPITPIPLPTVDVVDARGNPTPDGIITLRDINTEPNLTIYRNALAARGQTGITEIHLHHLIEPDNPNGPYNCGLWEDMVDNDKDGYTDDIAGMDFTRGLQPPGCIPTANNPCGTGWNTPTDSVANPGDPPNAVVGGGSGHGQEVAGILATVRDSESKYAVSEHAPDYVGQTFNVRVLPARGVNCPDPSTCVADVLPLQDAVDYATGGKNPSISADVVNMSLSLVCIKPGVLPNPPSCQVDTPDCILCSDPQKLKSEYGDAFALTNLSNVVLTVGPVDAPAKIDSDDVMDLPAKLLLPNQINVGTTKNDDTYRSDIVSWGPKTYQIAAPAESLLVLNFGGAGQFSKGSEQFCGVNVNGQTICGATGNSLTAPQVAGTAALILSVDHSLRGNAGAIKQTILDNADVVSDNANRVENGRRLNVARAIQNAP